MKTYLVGGAVRDRLLGLPVRERDWVVTGATPAQMRALGFRPADAHGAFPVFLHPETGDEYALARTEIKAGRGYRGFEVTLGPEVTIEQDLARRDLTINAMAEDEAGTVIDPFNGREDLENGLLRHVGPAFVEDPLRLLRVARFAARLGRWGFRVAHGTHGLMKRMAEQPEDLLAVATERVWTETQRALADDQPWRFFEVLHRCGALAVWQPALAAALDGITDGTDDGGHGVQCGPIRPPLQALQRAALTSLDPGVRLAALFVAAGLGEAECRRLKAPNEFARLVDLASCHLPGLRGAAQREPVAVLTLLERLRPERDPEGLQRLLLAWGAVEPAIIPAARDVIGQAAAAVATIDAAGLKARGLSGPALGAALREARLEAITHALSR